MRSSHAEKFNHDDVAPDYDADVANEGNPIRAGYSALLDWVVAEAAVGPGKSVLELGTGTGNLSLRLGDWGRLVCVDVSGEMLKLAKDKLADRANVDYIVADLLECFDSLEESFDIVVSTYAIHHLTAGEKSALFAATGRVLRPAGIAVFGDLMFEDSSHYERYLAELRAAGQIELADEIADEFFWDLSCVQEQLEAAGFGVKAERFSELSFGVSATMTPTLGATRSSRSSAS
ncbi:MAG: methyltransferase domain-containing protein [Acidobacteriota bacterium]|nr:methyltransferase domain-containing protein [Acidobacteriota bacterium]